MSKPNSSTDMIAARGPRLFILFYPRICLIHDPGILAESLPPLARLSPGVYACADRTRLSAIFRLASLAHIPRAVDALQRWIIVHPRSSRECRYAVSTVLQKPLCAHPGHVSLHPD